MVLEYFVWLRQESNKSIGSLKRTETGSGDAKINSGDAKNLADKSTKITIFIKFRKFGKHCEMNACKWAKLILISLLCEEFLQNIQTFQMKSRYLKFNYLVTMNI